MRLKYKYSKSEKAHLTIELRLLQQTEKAFILSIDG